MTARAYYENKIRSFLSADRDAILGELVKNHNFDLISLQRDAWLSQITNLQEQLRDFPDGDLFLEFSIPRMGKRVDALLVIGGILFLVEYKIGAARHDKNAIDQVVDYALDLKNFHEGSHNKYLVPILIASEAVNVRTDVLMWSRDRIASPLLSGDSGLGDLVRQVVSETPIQNSFDANEWSSTGYKPTPTIVEAAQALYREHSVEELSRSEAGVINLTETSQCIFGIMAESERSCRKSICFVTGVPGSGKTLAGLNITTHYLNTENERYAVFLSGNGPLVSVLREALARDGVERERNVGKKLTKQKALVKAKTFIQNIHHFRDEYVLDPSQSGGSPVQIPPETLVVFDEAQRAWDQPHAEKFMKRRGHNFSMSEPEFLISVMDRKLGSCTIVCLIGGGQEINNGEAGLTEWVNALEKRFRHWDIYVSDRITDKEYSWGQELNSRLSALGARREPSLHLSISIRSFRAEKLSDFVSAVIDGDLEPARRLLTELKNKYPIILTRDLARARAWLKGTARGTERYGLVASSGGLRLKPDGVFVKSETDPVKWFLNPAEDIRFSYYLEDVVTEFGIQGLELDWACVCWDGDFRRAGNHWKTYSFVGTRWRIVRDSFRQAYLANAYRVLMTRARQGMVIFVPRGDLQDATRLPEFYSQTFEFLSSCGLEQI